MFDCASCLIVLMRLSLIKTTPSWDTTIIINDVQPYQVLTLKRHASKLGLPTLDWNAQFHLRPTRAHRDTREYLSLGTIGTTVVVSSDRDESAGPSRSRSRYAHCRGAKRLSVIDNQVHESLATSRSEVGERSHMGGSESPGWQDAVSLEPPVIRNGVS